VGPIWGQVEIPTLGDEQLIGRCVCDVLPLSELEDQARMERREFITLVGGVAASWPLAARAQQPGMPVIGFLSSGQPQVFAHMIDAFRQGLSETGYVVGQNVAFEHRAAGSDYDRFRDMADERAGRADEPYSQRGDRSALPLRQPPPASPTHPNIPRRL